MVNARMTWDLRKRHSVQRWTKEHTFDLSENKMLQVEPTAAFRGVLLYLAFKATSGPRGQGLSAPDSDLSDRREGTLRGPMNVCWRSARPRTAGPGPGSSPGRPLTCALDQGLSQLPLLFPELSQVPPDLFLLLLQPVLLLCVPLHLGFCPVLAKFDLCKPSEGSPRVSWAGTRGLTPAHCTGSEGTRSSDRTSEPDTRLAEQGRERKRGPRLPHCVTGASPFASLSHFQD